MHVSHWFRPNALCDSPVTSCETATLDRAAPPTSTATAPHPLHQHEGRESKTTDRKKTHDAGSMGGGKTAPNPFHYPLLHLSAEVINRAGHRIRLASVLIRPLLQGFL